MKYIIFFLILFCFNPLLAQLPDLKPKIEYTVNENLINLHPTVLNSDEIVYELNYLFLVIKQGKAGNFSNQKQEGKFVIKGNEKKILSEMKLNFNDDDKMKAYLFIRDENNNKLISKDSLVLNYSSANQLKNSLDNYYNQVESNQNEFVIRGLVTDHTKSKLGKDFFDIFYNSYNLLDQKYPFLIEIYEFPPQGRNSKVEIYVEDKVLATFMLNPSEEYLKELNSYIFRQLINYDKNRKIINTY